MSGEKDFPRPRGVCDCGALDNAGQGQYPYHKDDCAIVRNWPDGMPRGPITMKEHADRHAATMKPPPSTANQIAEVLDKVESMLLDKNRKYGDSALNPVRIFSSADAVEQLKVRMDDKLSRIRAGQGDDNEDAELDLLGYLVLMRVARMRG